MSNYAIYIRVSTTRQGTSGLGLESQLSICQNYINSVNGTSDKVFKDVASGKSRVRKGLWDAIEYCKETGATLVIAKLDRLARDVEFTFKIKNTGINIYFCDMPLCNTMVLGMFATVAEYERELISTRTKNALQAKKDRGETLGRPKGCKASQNAIEASVRRKKEDAKANPHNIAFKREMGLWEAKNGKLSSNSDIQAFADELNSHEFKTATGMPFDMPRCRTMIWRIRKLYAV